jgi:hypothetical protein
LIDYRNASVTENYESSNKTFTHTAYDLLRIDARRRNAQYLLHRVTPNNSLHGLDFATTPHGYVFKTHSVANFENKCFLEFKLGNFKLVQPLTHQFIRALHPIVTLVKLTSILREFSEQIDVDQITKALLVNAFSNDKDVTIGLLHTLNCSGNEELSLGPFILHADNYFISDTNRSHSSSTNISSSQHFSFCAIQYSDNELVVCRIMAIISIVRSSIASNNEERFLLLVMRLHPYKPSNTAQVFPYTSLKYNYSREFGYELNLVELASFHTPVCVFESPIHTFETIATISTDTIFYQIPTKRLLDTEPVMSYDQFQEMRAESDNQQHTTTGVYLTEDELKEILDCYQSDIKVSNCLREDIYEGSGSDSDASELL